MEKPLRQSIILGKEKYLRLGIGRYAMRNPWAVGLIIFFSLLFLIGLNIGETDFLYNLGRTI
jgi:Ni/Fe-hydrogenase subunit HybB-like protein